MSRRRAAQGLYQREISEAIGSFVPGTELARYWGSDYDWRKCEAKLNALPNFITEIDGLDIHFLHVRSRHEDALPLIVTHG